MTLSPTFASSLRRTSPVVSATRDRKPNFGTRRCNGI
jgi:hypothetical protein